ncbi:TetR/AcrR family transcriptional regulator [Paenibacillus sp. YSY-4.3]
MAKVDRRIQKTQAALKNAILELMAQKNLDNITIQDLSDRANVSRGTIYLHYTDKFDLLDKLIESHINELRGLCESAADLDLVGATLIWAEYFDSNYSFFSTMLASKGAPYFRNRFQNFLVEELRQEVDVTEGKNQGLLAEVLVQFIASAQLGVVEWWFTHERPVTPQVLAKQLGTLLERNI